MKVIHTNVNYPRIHAGPLRGKYVHRVIAEALLRRRLRPEETVDHKDQNMLNFDPTNLQILSWKDHGRLTRYREKRQMHLEGIPGIDFVIILDGEELFKCQPEEIKREQQNVSP